MRPGLVSKPQREAGCRGPHAGPEGAPATRERSSSKEEQRAELRDTSHPTVSSCGGPGTLVEHWAKPKDEGRRAERPGPAARPSGARGGTDRAAERAGLRPFPSAPADQDTGEVSDLASRLSSAF